MAVWHAILNLRHISSLHTVNRIWATQHHPLNTYFKRNIWNPALSDPVTQKAPKREQAGGHYTQPRQGSFTSLLDSTLTVLFFLKVVHLNAPCSGSNSLKQDLVLGKVKKWNLSVRQSSPPCRQWGPFETPRASGGRNPTQGWRFKSKTWMLPSMTVKRVSKGLWEGEKRSVDLLYWHYCN